MQANIQGIQKELDKLAAQQVDELAAAPSEEGQSGEADPCFDPEPSTAGCWRGRIEAVGEGEPS